MGAQDPALGGAAPSDAPSSDVDGFHRVHRLTPLLRFWSLILAVFAASALNVNGSMVHDVAAFVAGGHLGEALKDSAVAIAVFVGVCAFIWLVSGLWWRRMGYRLDAEEISVRHGLLSTSLRSARYDRTQAVDVVESVIARLFGLAAVRVETAGGSGSVIEVAYLRKSDAEALRAEVLAQVRGTAPAADAPPADDAAPVEASPAEAAPPGTRDGEHGGIVVPEIPIARTLAAEAARPANVVLAAVAIALAVSPLPLSTALPILVAIIPNVWNLVDTSWRYNARISEDATGERTLNIAYGLADRRRQSIRLSRIHGVRVAQPFLWRVFGWYEVSVSVAGYGAKGGGKGSGSTRILPVGSREEALALFELVSDLSARQIADFAQPEGHTRPDFTSPKSAWLASPWDRAQQSITLVGDVAVTHAGRLTRRVMAINTSHIQELTYSAGPLSQLLGVGSVHFDLVVGPVSMAGSQLAPDDAAALMDRLRARRLPAMESTRE